VATVLLIEDEPTLRVSMARGLGRLPGVEVVAAGSLEEALPILDTNAPALVLSDIDLPGRSGIELLGELAKRGLRVPVVFISAYLKAYGTQIPPRADVEVREKPVSLEELRQLVVTRLGDVSGLESAPFSATDYLQLACIGRHSVVIDVGNETGQGGSIVVSAGDVWSAQDDQGEGEAAFRRLVRAPVRFVKCQTLRGTCGPRNLFDGYEHLLLEAARVADEGTQPESGGTAATPRGFDAVWEEGVKALRAKDYPRALSAFQEAQALKPGDAWVSVNLERLRRMGDHVKSGS
jgi:CheY-like chemotaxis protein